MADPGTQCLDGQAAARNVPDVPGFMRDRDDQARRAGLRVEHVIASHPRQYVTRYCGTKEQIGAAGFLDRDPEHYYWPKSRIPCGGVVAFRLGRAGVVRNGDATFAVKVEEDLPMNFTRVSAELERYEVHLGRKVRKIVHHGSKRALLAAGIAQDLNLPEHDGEAHDGDFIWHTKRAPNGWWVHELDLFWEQRVHKEHEEQLRVVRPIVLAPPVIPGSLTEGEKHHIRVLRTLSEPIRASLMALAESSSGLGQEREIYRPHLRLVVDNVQDRSPVGEEADDG